MRAVLQAHRVQDRGTVPIVRTVHLNCQTVRFYCQTVDAYAPQGSVSLFGVTCAASLGQAKVARAW